MDAAHAAYKALAYARDEIRMARENADFDGRTARAAQG